MSNPPSSPHAVYHSVPQSDVMIPASSDIELDGEDEVFDQSSIIALDTLVDTRIRWINFVFGCTLLLPWNGATLFYYLGVKELTRRAQL
jgi:equilibrative nucleoside transporter 1/2/3